MLSIFVLTAISAVALPHLRITTLSSVRTLTMAYALVVLVLVLSSTSHVYTLFNDGLCVDPLGTYAFLLLSMAFVSILAYYTTEVTSDTPYTVGVLLVILSMGAYYLAMSGDLLTFAVALELQSFSLYALTALYRWREGATSAGLTYFMLGAFSSGLVLLGISIIYAYTGETALTSLIAHYEFSGSTPFLKTSLVMILAGILFKVTAAPFHFWGPEVYDRVPTLITVIISVLPKFGLIAALVRLSPLIASASLTPFMLLVAMLSWAFGSVVGLVQSRIKRLLAYSTVSHVGWILAAISAGSSLGMGALLFYLVQYSFTSVLTFLALIALGASGMVSGRSEDIERINTLNGLWIKSALFSVMLATTLFSAAGIPPIVGFYAKLSVLQALLYSSDPLLVVVGVLSSVVSAGYYLSVITAMAFKDSVVTAAQ